MLFNFTELKNNLYLTIHMRHHTMECLLNRVVRDRGLGETVYWKLAMLTTTKLTTCDKMTVTCSSSDSGSWSRVRLKLKPNIWKPISNFLFRRFLFFYEYFFKHGTYMKKFMQQYKLLTVTIQPSNADI